MVSERRSGYRNTVIKTVRVAFEGATIRGTLLDQSPTGVKVCLARGAQVPDLVLLYLPDETVRAARVRWRNSSDVGFEFLFTDED
jgi:hypothetical protein